MKTKKILSLALAAVMALSASISVSAADITANGGSQSVIVTYGMDESFTVTIPSSINFAQGSEADFSVSAVDVIIGHGKYLTVDVESDNYYNDSWYLVDTVNPDNKIKYDIINFSEGDTLENGDSILTAVAGETKTSVCYANILDEVLKAGTYTDTLTFSVKIEELAKFTLTANYGDAPTDTFYFEEGMTWREWVASDYNTVGFGLMLDPDYQIIEIVGNHTEDYIVDAQADLEIIANQNYIRFGAY